MNLVFSVCFAILFVGLGIRVILRPEVVKLSMQRDDRDYVGPNFVRTVRIIGAGFIIMGVGQLIDALLHQ